MSIRRIIDANANRAREALRVMEEAARFVLNDAQLSGELKALRHELARALSAVVGLSANRDTPGDVGTHLSTAGESARAGVAEVTLAAARRLSEALRAIEEYAKTLGEPERHAGDDGPDLPARVEALRYRAYDLEQRLERALGSGRARQWRLCVLISQQLCADGDWLGVARAVLEAGADAVQLREKELEAGELLERARQLVDLARGYAASVIVNDRPDVALLAGADGVHLGQGDLPVAQARRLLGRQLIVGVSTSNLHQAHQAERDGADYCGVGPMFATQTKHKPELAGPDYLRQYVAQIRLPHLAIGGITLENLPELIAAGARGVAVSSAVCSAADPGAAAAAFLAQLPQGEPAVD